jgi:sulfofructosephosphate aldolase
MTSSLALDRLRGRTGRFSMLAIDQRESLRQMLSADAETPVDDSALVAFKQLVVQTLVSHASAVLIDHQYGGPAAAASTRPVILAADLLSQSVPGGPVNVAELDEEVTPEFASSFGAAALKMLVPWAPDRRDEAIDLSARFMALCRRAELPGIVEGVVRPEDIAFWNNRDRDAALVEAARDLATTQPDLYKAEVPSYGTGDPAAITAIASAITDTVDCPWVVLSSGVTAQRFPGAVQACVSGGAQGFLAGRAIWADATTAADPRAFLEGESVRRLRGLSDGEVA